MEDTGRDASQATSGGVTDAAPGESDSVEAVDTGEVDATDAARRKASQLGVKLFEVRGTGSNGRVLIKDVEKTARQSLA